MAPVCSVVIPSYNGRRLLTTCLASIERHRPEDVPIEVIVADDASTDETASWLSSKMSASVGPPTPGSPHPAERSSSS
jgi:glycosyltransferase involved in cell wall biosynthesis